MAVHAVEFEFLDDVRLLDLIRDGLIRLAFDQHVATELAGQNDERSVQQASLFQVEYQLGNRRVDFFLQLSQPRVAVVVCVPLLERTILGRDLDVARPGFGQSSSQQTALAKSAGVVFVVAFFRLERQIKRLRRKRGEQPIRIVDRAKESLAVDIPDFLLDRAGGDQFEQCLMTSSKLFHGHAGRWSHDVDRLARVGNSERTVLRTQTAPGLKGFQLFRLAIALVPLSDVDVAGHSRIPWAEPVCQPSPDVRSSNRQRWFVTGVPVVLVPRMQDVAEVPEDVRADQCAAIKDRGDFLESFGNELTVDRRWNRGKCAEDLAGFHTRRKRRVAFRIQRLRMSHASAHPEDDQSVSFRLGSLRFFLGSRVPGECDSASHRGHRGEHLAAAPGNS